jgi:hypothetical protein
MQRCAFCQGELDPATLICRACGRVQPSQDDDITLVPEGRKDALTRHCPNCNELLPAAARFCGRCGQTLTPLMGGAAGRALHDTGAPESKPHDYAITDALNRPARLADVPAGTPTRPENMVLSSGMRTETAKEAPKVSVAVERVEGSTLRRSDGGARQGPSGVAHGLRFRLLSRMQARIVATALVALLVVGGAVSVQSLLGTSRGNFATAIATPTSVAFASATPTAIAAVTPTSPAPASPTPTSELATPTPTSAASPPFRVTPDSFAQMCAGTAALPQLSVTLDNSAGSSPVTWQATISQTDPQGHVWATASPKSGTLASGAKAALAITPIKSLCQDMQGSVSPITYSVMVSYLETGQPESQEVTVSVTPPA